MPSSYEIILSHRWRWSWSRRSPRWGTWPWRWWGRWSSTRSSLVRSSRRTRLRRWRRSDETSVNGEGERLGNHRKQRASWLRLASSTTRQLNQVAWNAMRVEASLTHSSGAMQVMTLSCIVSQYRNRITCPSCKPLLTEITHFLPCWCEMVYAASTSWGSGWFVAITLFFS